MKRKYLAIIEWIVAIILFVLCYWFYLSYGSFSSIKAHEFSEKTMHYGPSTIIKEIDLNKRKVYLCRYKDWISADVVEKGLIKWYPGSPAGPCPIDYTKKINYTWGGLGPNGNKESLLTVIGYVNDPSIITINLEAKKSTGSDVQTLKYKLDNSHMFIFTLTDKTDMYYVTKITGLDKDGKVVYEEKLP